MVKTLISVRPLPNLDSSEERKYCTLLCFESNHYGFAGRQRPFPLTSLSRSHSLSGRISSLEEEAKEVRSSLSEAESTKRELQQTITDLEKVRRFFNFNFIVMLTSLFPIFVWECMGIQNLVSIVATGLVF